MLELKLEEVVADILVLGDSVSVILTLEEVVADILELKLLDRDDDGELDVTDPAPTATNAIYVDCDHTPLVGSELPTM
jgi:hypothetical protein